MITAHKVMYQREWRRLNREHVLESKRKWAALNPEKVAEQRKRRWASEKYKKQQQIKGKRLVVALKERVIRHYSNDAMCCVNCGINDLDVLCLDHINDDRYKSKEGGTMIYRRVVREGFPPTFRVLCANCNLKKEMVKRRGGEMLIWHSALLLGLPCRSEDIPPFVLRSV